MNEQGRESRSFLTGLILTTSQGFFYGVGLFAARHLYSYIQRDSHTLTPKMHQEIYFNYSFNIHDIVKRLHVNSLTRKKSIGWLALCALHPYYLSFLSHSFPYINHLQTFLWSVYPIFFTWAIISADGSEQHGDRKVPKTLPDSLYNEDQASTIDMLHASDSLVGKSTSDSVATQTTDHPVTTEPTSPYTNPTANLRYVELLVHNVSHTDLVLSLIPPAVPSLPHEIINTHESSCENQINTPSTKHSRSSWWHYSNKSELKAPPPPSDAVDMKDDAPTCIKEEDSSNIILCKPRFSAFDMYCRRALSVLKKHTKGYDLLQNQTCRNVLLPSVMSFPLYERSESTTRFSLVGSRPSKQWLLPVGFHLQQLMGSTPEEKKFLSLDKGDLMSLRIRGKDVDKLGTYISTDSSSLDLQSHIQIDAVLFPLLSSLMRRWHEQIQRKFGPGASKNMKKVIILVTGVGTPRNFTHSVTGNSTEACAELMEIFIQTLYQDVTVVKLHSNTEIFRYDENIKFATRELMPCIDAYRDSHARGECYPDEKSTMINPPPSKGFDPDWKQTFSVTLSFADGAPARTHAIQAALRPYRPQYFHFWQLKTFWHDTKICDDDIEVHSFEEMETVPAMEISKTSAQVQMVVDEIKKFRESFLETVQNERNDIRQFWLRKTKKPVLAVLLVEQTSRLVMYRGTNMEVSMPTGSLCAERSVIGAALANNPGLKREDLRMVAVLAVPLPCDENTTTPSIILSSPGNVPKVSGAFSKYDPASLISEVENKLKLNQRREVTRSMSVGSFASIVVEGDEPAISPDDDSLVLVSSLKSDAENKSWEELSPVQSKQVNSALDGISLRPRGATDIQKDHDISSMIMNPVRRIKLYADAEEPQTYCQPVNEISNVQKKRQKRTVLVHFSDDLNPLRPCGACNEWLKKIAECNPSFKIITFTDADCNGVYVTPCQE